MKLKKLLEGYSWERNADGSLPTLKDTTKQHQLNIKEQNEDEDLLNVTTFDKFIQQYGGNRRISGNWQMIVDKQGIDDIASTFSTTIPGAYQGILLHSTYPSKGYILITT